jgi:hypothetical protein
MLPPTTPPLTLVDPPTVRTVYDNPPFVAASPLRRWATTVLARARRTEAADACRCRCVATGSTS